MRLTRLSPKALFLGIVALGLPFAVTVGWSLAAPAAAPPPPPAAAPAGAGVIGAAPPRPSASASDTGADYSTRAARAWSGRPAATASPAARRSKPAGAPMRPVPTLTDPPVPTPTAATSTSPSPSATTSPSGTPEPTGGGLLRR